MTTSQQQQPPKSIYERPSGRTASHPSSHQVDKSAHLSSARDPFKPRESDCVIAILSPAAIFAYNWKRAGLPVSALQNFSQLYMWTWLVFAVTAVPWVLRVGNDIMERPMGDIQSVFAVWPLYKYTRYAFVVPYLLQVVLAVKSWWLARQVTALAVEHCEDPTKPLSSDRDLDVHLFNFDTSFPDTLLSDLFTLRLQAKDILIDDLMKPPTAQDVGGEEELEDNLFTAMPSLMAAWYGPMRPLNILLSAMSVVFYVFLATLLGMLFGWPVEFLIQWTGNGALPKDYRAITDLYRGSFMNAAWLLLYTAVPSVPMLALMVLCYRVGKERGISMQMVRAGL